MVVTDWTEMCFMKRESEHAAEDRNHEQHDERTQARR